MYTPPNSRLDSLFTSMPCFPVGTVSQLISSKRSHISPKALHCTQGQQVPCAETIERSSIVVLTLNYFMLPHDLGDGNQDCARNRTRCDLCGMHQLDKVTQATMCVDKVTPGGSGSGSPRQGLSDSESPGSTRPTRPRPETHAIRSCDIIRF
jgi:hypothetical protein